MGDKLIYAGDTPALAVLQRGSIVVLISKASKRSLRIRDDIVEGVGGDGTMAQFIVHISHPGVIALQNVHCPQKWLHIKDGNTGGRFVGMDYCEFKVEDHGGYVVLESTRCPGQHVGILPNGGVKPPFQTGKGEHGQFGVKPLQEPPSLMVPSKPCPPGSPSAVFSHGNIICLESKASSRNLRLYGDTIDGNGATGRLARWIVHVYGHKIIALQNVEQSGRWLRIHDGIMDATKNGGGGSWCQLKYEQYDGYVVLESVVFPGQHIGIKPDGTSKAPNRTGTGEHARFRPLLMERQPRFMRAGDSHLMRTLTHGNKVVLYSRASGKTLRVRGGGAVDGNGLEGQFAQFIVHIRAPKKVGFKSITNSKWLCVRDGQLTDNGDGGPHCQFNVKEADGNLVFESFTDSGKHIGVLPNGSAKPPGQTGTGPHGQFMPKIKEASPYVTYIGGLNGVLTNFVEGHTVVLQSRANGQSLRINGDRVEATGGKGQWAQFIVHIRGPGIVSFENVGFRNKWLAINNDQLCVGHGGFYTQFIVKEIAGRYVALESQVFRSHHAGVLPNGCLKPPSQTRTGEHGQFTPFPV